MAFSTFQLLYISIKWMGVALVTQLIVNACQKDYSNAVLAIERTTDSSNKTEHFSYKGEWANV